MYLREAIFMTRPKRIGMASCHSRGEHNHFLANSAPKNINCGRSFSVASSSAAMHSSYQRHTAEKIEAFARGKHW